ncbi:MAG: hypothetical protein AB7U23_12435 [Dehalococcoidia bacterium]
MKFMGLDMMDIPEKYTAVGVYALVECLNEEGSPVFLVRHAGMDHLRRVGALHILSRQEDADWRTTSGGDDDD